MNWNMFWQILAAGALAGGATYATAWGSGVPAKTAIAPAVLAAGGAIAGLLKQSPVAPGPPPPQQPPKGP